MISSEDFVELCKSGSVQQVREAILAGVCIDAKSQDNRTALMAAAEENRDPEVIHVLLEADADIEAKDQFGSTALMNAARKSNVEAVRVLLEASADVEAKDEDGHTALMMAARDTVNPETVKVLLHAGADVNAKSEDGTTVLMDALLWGIGINEAPEAVEIVKLLLQAGADTGVRDTLGGTLLTVAADGANKPKMIKELIDVGLEVDARDNDGMTALMMASRWNSPQVVKALLEVGADVNAKLEASTTALTTDRADGDIFAAIIHGKQTDVPVDAGTTVLMLAALNNRKPDVVRVLLDAGSDVNARDKVGRTALMLASRWNTSRIIDTLLDAGADIAIKDDEGRQAADYAQENRNLKSRYVQMRLKGEETEVQRHIDEKSDERSNPVAQFIAGLMGGRGRDASTAASYQQAAEQGDSDSQCNLGFLYRKGWGVAPDDTEAAKWYRKAAEQGDAVAQFNLGQMYEKGEGVGQDREEAVKWYREAAGQGDAEARSRLYALDSAKKD